MHGSRARTGHEQDISSRIGGSQAHVPATKRGIRYLFEGHPKGAETFEVAPGILWARIPLPFRLNHVNVWLARDDDGWTIVDTGTSNAEARAVWDLLLAGVLSGGRIARLVATHGHTDHVGLAGWLHEISDGVPYYISMVEWLHAQYRIDDAKAPMRPTTFRFMTGHGVDEETVESFVDERRRTNMYMLPLPSEIRRLKDGSKVRFGGREWEVMMCGGHAHEHCSFWCAEDKILIAGDQILSKISPMIGVFWTEPEADPLTEYLASLSRFHKLPADALVLPSHGLPFYGLHERVDELAEHHDHRLGHLMSLMKHPETAMKLAHGLFPKAVAEGQGRHAFAETLAHAHHLVTKGRASRTMIDGQFRFTALK